MKKQKREQVFMIMSFDEKYYNLFNMIQAIASQSDVEATRADEDDQKNRKIRPAIFSQIREAVMIISEISSGRANVFYETGWAHALGKTTLLLAEENAEIPFDLDDYRVVKYNPNLPPSTLKKNLQLEFNDYLAAARQGVFLRQPLIEVLGSIEEVIHRNDLFTHLLAWYLERFSQESKRWTGNSIDVDAAEAVEKGIKIFKMLKKGGFCTYLVPLNSLWKTDTQYLEQCRLAVKERGVSIKRVFLVPTHETLFDRSLREHVERDEDAGIQTTVALVDNIPEMEAVQDFGIWDDELLCQMHVRIDEPDLDGGDPIVQGCTFTRDPAAMEKAVAWKDTILSVEQPANELFASVDSLDDGTKLLLRSADYMRREARRHCHGSYLTGGSSTCDWYHQSWQYLRMLGLVSTPGWHSNFYRRCFDQAFESEVREVLVSGTADFAIVDHLARCVPPELLNCVVFTVLDICWTPISSCKWYDRWYKENTGKNLNLRVAQRDALDSRFENDVFDMITTDAFLTRFPETQRNRLVSEWHRILKPGGRIVTTARLSGGSKVEKVICGDGEIEDFVLRAYQGVEERKSWLGPMKSIIGRLARNYASNIISYPLPSEDYISELFHGFTCTVESEYTQAEFEGRTKYARILAIKK